MVKKYNFKLFVLYHNSEFPDLIALSICSFSELSIGTVVFVSPARFSPLPSDFDYLSTFLVSVYSGYWPLFTTYFWKFSDPLTSVRLCLILCSCLSDNSFSVQSLFSCLFMDAYVLALSPFCAFYNLNIFLVKAQLNNGCQLSDFYLCSGLSLPCGLYMSPISYFNSVHQMTLILPPVSSN